MFISEMLYQKKDIYLIVFFFLLNYGAPGWYHDLINFSSSCSIICLVNQYMGDMLLVSKAQLSLSMLYVYIIFEA